MDSGSEYIYVNIFHRQYDPKKPEYERATDYYKRMESVHGLVHEPLHTFKKNKEWVRCFKVIDKIKALEFVFKFSEHIEKPET